MVIGAAGLCLVFQSCEYRAAWSAITATLLSNPEPALLRAEAWHKPSGSGCFSSDARRYDESVRMLEDTILKIGDAVIAPQKKKKEELLET